MAAVELHDLVKRYGKTVAVRGIDLAIADGEFVVLVGPSGCGKSTTLRMIAGLEDISEGVITIGGTVVNQLPPKQRNIAMVFQNYAIYPHRTVGQNIGFGLYTSRLSGAERQQRIEAAARTLGLEDLLDRRPSELSGGQRQRVAIGRALVRDPSVFLFDEPLSNLDAQLRAQMRVEIKRLHHKLGRTTVYVTHDQIEAMTMADRVVVMRDGLVLQIGTPTELYEQPVDVFTARFIGSPSMNLLDGMRQGDAVTLGSAGDSELLVGIRPHDFLIGDASGQGAKVTGAVLTVEPLGAETLVYMDVAGKEVVATAPGKLIPAVGSTVSAHAAPGSLYLFDRKSEKFIGRA